MLTKGRTAIEGLSGSAGRAVLETGEEVPGEEMEAFSFGLTSDDGAKREYRAKKALSAIRMEATALKTTGVFFQNLSSDCFHPTRGGAAFVSSGMPIILFSGR
jgi:hypothetical protein